MRTSLKLIVATVALITPIALGWAYTAGASVGDAGPALGSIFGDETVDEFSIDGYLITRESTDGVVTMQVEGPDGLAIDPADLPADIAAEFAYYESDWSPEDVATFGDVDGQPCLLPVELSPGDGLDAVQTDDDRVLAFAASMDLDGTVSSWAAQFNAADLSDEDWDLLESPGPFDSIEGGTPLLPCGG